MLKLSVVVPVYNLEKYIEDCLLSLLDQKTNFDYEVIVADDCSTDKSVNIIRRLKKQYPLKLKVISKIKNAGLAENLHSLLEIVSGEYIAYMDGDDLALPHKLQYQVDYLDSNKQCNMVFHESDVFDSETNLSLKKYSKDYYNWQYIPQKSTVNHLIKYGTYLQAGSIMFRNHSSILSSVSKHCKIILDYPFYIANAAMLGGTIDFIDETLSRYRIHQNSFCQQTQQSASRRLQSMKDMIETCKEASKFGVNNKVIKKGINHLYYSTALYFIKKNNLQQFQILIEKSSNGKCFFDDRHQLAYERREHPNLVCEKLGLTKC